MEKPTLISLYSGCGGSALGFQNAGFEITYMNDNNADACYTLKENFEKPSANPDRQVVQRGNVKDVFEFGSADIIEGGFPCQGFSLAGPRKVDDKRNMLYHYLKRAITFANPKFFVAENVKGFVTIGENAKQSFFKKGKIANLGSVASAIVKELEATGAGYNVKYELLDAKDYGLPQDRQRIFIVGVRKDLEYEFEFPKPTHGPGLKPYVTMKDYGVRDIHSLETEVFRDGKSHGRDYFGARYMSRNRLRKWNDVSFTIPADAGQVAADPDSKTMWAKEIEWWFEMCLKEVKDHEWPEFRKNNENKINPNLRRMSWRQCAAIQGFPKDYKFSGDVKSIYRQIGNAVPPPMMQQVAECIKPYFEGKESSFPMKKEKITA